MKTNQITKIFVYIFLLLLLCFTSDMQNEWVFVHWGKTISNISNYLNENGDVNTLLSLATIFIMFYFSYINLTDYSKKYLGLYIVIVLDCILLFSILFIISGLNIAPNIEPIGTLSLFNPSKSILSLG